jgi:hypothetical protein
MISDAESFESWMQKRVVRDQQEEGMLQQGRRPEQENPAEAAFRPEHYAMYQPEQFGLSAEAAANIAELCKKAYQQAVAARKTVSDVVPGESIEDSLKRIRFKRSN